MNVSEKIKELEKIANQKRSNSCVEFDNSDEIEVADKALEVILALRTLLSAALMRIDYYEEQEKEANNK